jgi:hypothetical protein
MPTWLRLVSKWLPMRRGIRAARLIVAGGPTGEAWRLLTGELVVGLVYRLVGYLLFRTFETAAKRRGSLERTRSCGSSPATLWLREATVRSRSSGRWWGGSSARSSWTGTYSYTVTPRLGARRVLISGGYDPGIRPTRRTWIYG